MIQRPTISRNVSRLSLGYFRSRVTLSKKKSDNCIDFVFKARNKTTIPRIDPRLFPSVCSLSGHVMCSNVPKSQKHFLNACCTKSHQCCIETGLYRYKNLLYMNYKKQSIIIFSGTHYTCQQVIRVAQMLIFYLIYIFQLILSLTQQL